MTQAQRDALDNLLHRYGLPEQGGLDWDTEFGRKAPRYLEIGFGNGDNLLNLARNNPDIDFIGIEVHRPGVGRLLHEVEKAGLSNVRVSSRDAVEVLQQQVADASLDAIFILFPDPWHKKRHNKLRLVNSEFAQLLLGKLRQGGQVKLATDWQDYALQMVDVLNANAGLRNEAKQGDYVPRPEWRMLTRFEQRGLRLGHGVWDLLYIKI